MLDGISLLAHMSCSTFWISLTSCAPCLCPLFWSHKDLRSTVELSVFPQNRILKLLEKSSQSIQRKSQKSIETEMKLINWCVYVKINWQIVGLCVRRHLKVRLSIESPQPGMCINFLVCLDRSIRNSV